MSSKNIVNPDHYKIGGRDKANEHVPAGKRPLDRQQDEKAQERWQEREKEKKDRE